jgi:alcohol dehydrogenase class IV
MENMNWNYPTNIWFGEKRIKEIQQACENLNIKNPLIVTDPGILKTNIVQKINESLNSKADIFSDVQSNPTGNNVEEGVLYFNSNSNDGVIAVGGGSGMDVGKGIAFMAGQNRPLWDFEDIGDYWSRANSEVIKPIIAVPTTAGTGSETGRAGVYTNEKTHEKKIIFHPKMLPSIVILDPVLTIDLSPRLTAATGMDALAHNLEAFCAPGFHPMADGIAIEGMKLIKKSLLNAVNNGKDLEARSDLLAAASMGSTAFQKGLGAIHSLSHPINAQFNVHHGLSNAIFMPYVLTFNKNFIDNRIVSICDYLNLEKNFDSFLNWVLELRKKLSIPHKLSEVIEIKKINIDQLSKMALEDPSTATNPKKMTIDDMKILYKHSISGKLF